MDFKIIYILQLYTMNLIRVCSYIYKHWFFPSKETNNCTHTHNYYRYKTQPDEVMYNVLK